MATHSKKHNQNIQYVRVRRVILAEEDAVDGGDGDAAAGADGGASHNEHAWDPSEPHGAEVWPDGSAERLALNPPPSLSSDEIIKQITHRTDEWELERLFSGEKGAIYEALEIMDQPK